MDNQKIILVTAPSGAGKTTIVKYLLQHLPSLQFSISATTRAQRGVEQNGKDYHFLSTIEFEKKIKEQAFVEWEMVYNGLYYGTLKTELEGIWKQNNTPILDIDVKGATTLQNYFKEKALSIFIAPPSVEALRQRLVTRATDSTQAIDERIKKAQYEIDHSHFFNVLIVNNSLTQAAEMAQKAVQTFLNT